MLTFAPDATDIAPEILTAVSGIPTMRGYASPPTAGSALASALAAAPNGGNIVLTSTGASRILVATSAKIYEFGSGAWTDRGSWAGNKSFFLPFGQEIFAIGTAQKPTKVAGSLTAVTAPKAAAGDSNEYFMMLGNTDDTSVGLSTSFGAQIDGWWCSRYADATTAWNPDVTFQCNRGQLADTAGAIIAIRALGDKFVAYKMGAIYLGYYAGPPEVFKFQRITDQIGAYSQSCVIKASDGVHYFIGSENIWRFDGNGAPTPIGDGIREWFFASLDRPNNSLIQGRHDPYNRLVYWHYPGAGGSTINKVLVYHYPTGRFGAFDLTVTQVFNTEGGQLFATTSDGTAKQLSMVYTDASYVIKSLSAAGTALTMTTNWYGDENQVSLCHRVKPKFRTAFTTGALVHSTSMFIGDTPVVGSSQSMSNGRYDILMSGRYHRDAHTYTGDGEIELNNGLLIAEGTE